MAAVTAAMSLSASALAAPACRIGEKSSISGARLSLAVPARCRVVMSAEKKENLALPTTIALVAAAVLPEIAEAASPGVSPSLKNLLLSVVAGGVVLSAIGVAVAGVSVFDPVKRK